MNTALDITMIRQPNDVTCGPTCLHAIYRYYGDTVSLHQVVAETPTLRSGGTLAVFLACHALQRGYRATIYTYNLQFFDPTWFTRPGVDVRQRLREQRDVKSGAGLKRATAEYVRFLELGGDLRFEDLTRKLIRTYINRRVPILSGVSATFLYRAMREFGPADDEDDVRGEPVGHFVVLSGYDPEKKEVLIADPIDPNPYSQTHYYAVGIDRVLGAIYLGVLTHDANLLVIEPRGQKAIDGTPRSR